MTELLTAAQMRAIEQAAIESGEVTGLELMERAGAGVVGAIFEEWPELARGRHRAVVLCGPGNNGGDGFVVARLLAARGWEVAVFLYGDGEKLPPDARTNHRRWRHLGPVRPACPPPNPPEQADLLVDALFGTGLTRAVDDPCLHQWFGRIGSARSIAIDLPSGLDTDSGEILGAAPAVALTITFHRKKRAHMRGQGPQKCGKVVVKGIGL